MEQYTQHVHFERLRLRVDMGGTQKPSRPELERAAMVPVGPQGDPSFSFSKVWDIDDPNQYFETKIMPRRQRMKKRWDDESYNKSVQPRASKKKVGDTNVEEEGDDLGNGDESG